MLISVDKQHELSWNPSWTDIWHYAVKNWCFFKAFNRGLDFQLVCSTRGAGLATQVCVTLPAQAVPPQTEVGRAGGPEERAGDSSSLAFPGRAFFLISEQTLLQVPCTSSPIWLPDQPLPILTGLGMVAELRTVFTPRDCQQETSQHPQTLLTADCSLLRAKADIL